MYNKATKYLYAGKHAKALAFYKKEPLEFKEKYLNMGNCYKQLGDLDNALKCYLRAADASLPNAEGVRGEYALAYNNLGLLSYAMGNDDDAISFYKAALKLNPMHQEAIWNHANATLRRYFSSDAPNPVDWQVGWQLYEYRFKRENGAVRISCGVLPRWDGISSGDSICVIAEQGLGDKIMFGRYIHCLRSYFKTVYVQCHPSLDVFFSDFEICRDAVGSCYVPICSLAGHFGLVSEKWLEGKFNARDFGSGLNIGCVWSGSNTHANDRNRSCPSSYFSGLAKYGNLYSLNPGARPAKNVLAIGTKDWSSTASAILGLDVVVTVDTSIVHLAGTLGVPCIMVQPVVETDFRWGLGHSDTPWYKSVVIVNHTNWDTAFSIVGKLLGEMHVRNS